MNVIKVLIKSSITVITINKVMRCPLHVSTSKRDVSLRFFTWSVVIEVVSVSAKLPLRAVMLLTIGKLTLNSKTGLITMDQNVYWKIKIKLWNNLHSDNTR